MCLNRNWPEPVIDFDAGFVVQTGHHDRAMAAQLLICLFRTSHFMWFIIYTTFLIYLVGHFRGLSGTNGSSQEQKYTKCKVMEMRRKAEEEDGVTSCVKTVVYFPITVERRCSAFKASANTFNGICPAGASSEYGVIQWVRTTAVWLLSNAFHAALRTPHCSLTQTPNLVEMATERATCSPHTNLRLTTNRFLKLDCTLLTPS